MRKFQLTFLERYGMFHNSNWVTSLDTLDVQHVKWGLIQIKLSEVSFTFIKSYIEMTDTSYSTNRVTNNRRSTFKGRIFWESSGAGDHLLFLFFEESNHNGPPRIRWKVDVKALRSHEFGLERKVTKDWSRRWTKGTIHPNQVDLSGKGWRRTFLSE